MSYIIQVCWKWRISLLQFVIWCNPTFLSHRNQILLEIVLDYTYLGWERLRKFFDRTSRFCLTIETWISVQTLDYMSVTSHFTMIWTSQGWVTGKTKEACLLEWDIDIIFIVIIDNANCSSPIIWDVVHTLWTLYCDRRFERS